MRTIDADALIEEVQDWVDPSVLTFINNAPTVEPERPQGDSISREALKKDIEENSIILEGVQAIEVDCAKALIDLAQPVKPNWKFYYDHGYAQAKRDLKRPQGEWVYESGTVNSVFRCSNCGRFNPHDIFVKENDDRYTRLEREDANRFCWHCGAAMRKGDVTNDSQDK